jgi:hypothetical protein
MADGILGNAISAFGFPKTYILTDENGNELIGTYVESKTIFTATDNDVREGMVYASDKGVSTGTKDIPIYYASEGAKLIKSGSSFVISIGDYYDYTKFQAIICSYNTSLSHSVAAEKVAILDNVYNVQSVTPLSSIIINNENKTIDFGIVNTSDSACLVRYFTYKEVY